MDSISHPNAAEDRGLRKWFFLALLISLIFHAVLAAFFQAKKLEHFESDSNSPRLVPRPQFKAEQRYYDPTIFADAKPKSQPSADLTRPPVLLRDRPSATLPKDARLTPQVAETPKFAPDPEKPEIKESAAPKGNNAAQSELAAIAKSLFDRQPVNPATSKVPFPTTEGNGTSALGSGTSKSPTAYSNLNTLLEQTGELTGPIAPVNMPGGALFEYDSADLRQDAIATLQKLGELIVRNPRATFSIEGYTDSFGTAQYNLALSQSRAEAVKAWLISNMHLDPSRIETHGFGSTRLIVPATKSKEEQQINRRVEIVIRTPKE